MVDYPTSVPLTLLSPLSVPGVCPDAVRDDDVLNLIWRIMWTDSNDRSEPFRPLLDSSPILLLLLLPQLERAVYQLPRRIAQSRQNH